MRGGGSPRRCEDPAAHQASDLQSTRMTREVEDDSPKVVDSVKTLNSEKQLDNQPPELTKHGQQSSTRLVTAKPRLPLIVCSNSVFYDSKQLAPYEVNMWFKPNAWRRPFHILGVVTNVVVLLFVFAFFLLSVRCLPSRSARITLWTVGGVLAIPLVASLLYTMSVDPQNADCRRNVSHRNAHFVKQLGIPVIDLDTHVCGICQVKVPATTRHCKPCNKCVDGFDHHCDYLSTCIGGRNYRSFFTSIVLTTVLTAMLSGASIAAFVCRFTDRDGFAKRARLIFHDDPSLSAENACAVLTLVVGIAALGVCGYSVYLTFFHCRLLYYGLPTWKYLDALEEHRYDVARSFTDIVLDERRGLGLVKDDEKRDTMKFENSDDPVTPWCEPPPKVD